MSTHQSAAGGDQFAQPGAVQALRVTVLARRLGVRQSGEEFQPAAATIGVEPWRCGGHRREVADWREVRQGRVRSATETALTVGDKAAQDLTITTGASRLW
ncbi:hypothetical protein GCM10012284_44840 [Mangrovihabitans endophyticus]|uniref:Uncharacterized protein n=1 Tax=Mangrovihabitans endophyticus TaxID=1751298 RepID=A0A8J3C1M1_9ACTN|nr:hypothetical protein GCM10012284_44840 [Mangrovihabitans endophyticus]